METLANGTAEFTGVGMTAYSSDTGCSFSFPDDYGTHPDVVKVVISGILELEGVAFVNNGVPGHEFS